MHDEPRPTHDEQTPERLEEEEDMRGSLEPDAETPGSEGDNDE